MLNFLNDPKNWGLFIAIPVIIILVIMCIKMDAIANYFKFEEKKDEPD